jgi:hypothetical protein
MSTFFNGVIGFQTQTVTISSGQTTSDAVNLNGFGMVGLILPSALTSTSMTFTGSQDNSTFTALYNTAGVQLAITLAASRIILFVPGDFVGINYLKLVAGSAEGSDRLIQVISRSFQ